MIDDFTIRMNNALKNCVEDFHSHSFLFGKVYLSFFE